LVIENQYKLRKVKTIISILSLAIALNLGSQITVSCNMPTCAMQDEITCSCNNVATDMQMDGCCQHDMASKTDSKTSSPKCNQSRIDGVFVPTFTITHVDTYIGFLTEISLLSIDGHSRMFTPQPTNTTHFKPDKYLNLPLLI